MCSDCRVQHQVENVDFSLAAVDMEGGLHDNMNHYDFFPESMQLHEADIEAVVGPISLENSHDFAIGDDFLLHFHH